MEATTLYKGKKYSIPTGSILDYPSNKTVDIIFSCLSFLEDNIPEAFNDLITKIKKDNYSESFNASYVNKEYSLECVDGSYYYDSEFYEESEEFCDNLLCCNMENITPDGFYFGNAEGDGASLGFWKTEECEL